MSAGAGSPLVPDGVSAPRPPPGESRLIRDPDDREVLTGRRETDARTALARGLAEYVAQLEADWSGTGRRLRLLRVNDSWATAEMPAVYPGASVYGVVEGTYGGEAARMSPQVVRLATGEALSALGPYAVTLVLDVWSTDPRERVGLASMLEDAFSPVDWMTGFRLELPHYHGTRGTYVALQSQYLDEEAERRIRRLQFILSASLRTYRSLGRRPDLKVRTDVDDL